MRIEDFVRKERNRIWAEGTKHQHDSIRRIEKLTLLMGNLELSQLDADKIHDFFDKLQERGLSVASIDRYGATISSVMKHAKRTKKITEKPDFVWRKQPENRVRFFTDKEREQLVTFLKYSDAPWMADMVLLSLNTGMRLGEIKQLMNGSVGFRNDLDSDRPCIYLPRTKNGSERYIPLSNTALKAATRLHNCKSFNAHTFYQVWGEARHRIARGDKNFVFHVCRHTCATMMANKLQTNTIVIMDMLGHRNHKTTQKYVHGVSSTRFKIADDLDKLN